MMNQVDKMKLVDLLSHYYQAESVPSDIKKKVSKNLLAGNTDAIMSLQPVTNQGITFKSKIVILLNNLKEEIQ